MKRFVWLFCLIVLFSGCGGGGPDTIIPSEPQRTIVFMGDSITFGTFVEPSECYVSLLQKTYKNDIIINKGVPGAKSYEGANIIEKYLIEYKPNIITIYYGTNDIGFYNVNLIMDSIKYMVDISRLHNAIPIVFTLGPFLGDWSWRAPYAIDLNNKIREYVEKEKILCVDLEKSMNWNPDLMIMPDGEHPNAKGHQVIANTFTNVLK